MYTFFAIAGLKSQCNSSRLFASIMAYDSDLDSDTDSCTMQILWERDPNLNLSQWKHVLHNTM